MDNGSKVAPGWSTRLNMRGMLATAPIKAGEVIEIPPVLKVPPQDLAALGSTFLRRYLFTTQEGVVLCLGHGSLYNHAPEPNADMQQHGSRLLILARSDIEVGDEVFISYGDDEADVAERYGFLEK